MRTRARARVYSRSRVGAYARIAPPRIRTPTCIFACTRIRYMTRATDTCKRLSPLSLLLSFSIFSFSHPPFPPIAASSSFALTLAHSLRLSLSYSLSPSALFKYPLPNFLLSFSFFHSFPLLLYAFISLYSIPFLSISPKLLPLSLATAYTVEAAQAAEGHRSQLWTYLDRQARSEVLDLLCPASLSSVLSPVVLPFRCGEDDDRTSTVRTTSFLRLPPISSGRAEISPSRQTRPVPRSFHSRLSFFRPPFFFQFSSRCRLISVVFHDVLSVGGKSSKDEWTVSD